MLMDGDCFFTFDVVSKYREVAAKGFGASVVFTDTTQPKPIYSYVKVDDDQSMKINKIIEKVKNIPDTFWQIRVATAFALGRSFAVH